MKEKQTSKQIFQKTLSMLLIILMLVSIFPVIVSAVEDNDLIELEDAECIESCECDLCKPEDEPVSIFLPGEDEPGEPSEPVEPETGEPDENDPAEVFDISPQSDDLATVTPESLQGSLPKSYYDSQSTVADVIVPPLNTLTAIASINLTRETIYIHPQLQVAAYSVNCGRSWKNGDIPRSGPNFSRLLNRRLELWVRIQGVNGEIQFPAINARPGANPEKLRIFYGSNFWDLRTSDNRLSARPYDGALEGSNQWFRVNWITDWFNMRSGNTRTRYIFRTAAFRSGNSFTPAGKPFRITPANYGKPPNRSLRANRTIRFSKGDAWAIFNSAGTRLSAIRIETSSCTWDFASVSGIGLQVRVWRPATGRQPTSMVRLIPLT